MTRTIDESAATPPPLAPVAGGGTASATLLDAIQPVFDFGHRTAIVVDAPAARVAEAVGRYQPARESSWFARLLFRLRGLAVPARALTLRDALLRDGFCVLAERPGEEIVFGIAGRFWALDEMRSLIGVPDAQRFREFAAPGTAKAAMSVRTQPLAAARTLLATETRVTCTDRAAHRRFALYWLFIKPFSRWLRWEMLRAIARRATGPDR